MFKKMAFALMVALSSQLQVYAAGCDVPTTERFTWNENKYCAPGSNCIIDWNGYGWWTNFHANQKDYFYESKQAYDPRNVAASPKGLELKIRKSNLGGGLGWTAAEAVLVSNKDGSPVNIGYGHYLVTVESPVPISEMDPATVFGAFTYYRKNVGGKDIAASGGENNLKELDMIELSKWGWNGQGRCPFSGPMAAYGCSGSFQMGTQPWEQLGNLKRFPEKDKPDLAANETTLTTYMFWENENKPIQYKVFKGKVGMETAKNQEGNIAQWTMENAKYVPSERDDCVRLHLNFYRAVYSSSGDNTDTAEQIRIDAARNINVQPKNQETSIYVTNFEYEAKK